MKIEGREWMDWLHKSRADTERRRKANKETLAQYLRSVEDNGVRSNKKNLRPREKGVK